MRTITTRRLGDVWFVSWSRFQEEILKPSGAWRFEALC
jgi:hypothetical protein